MLFVLQLGVSHPASRACLSLARFGILEKDPARIEYDLS